MPEPAYAVVDILCDRDRLGDLKAIPNLQVKVRPEYTADPSTVLVHAFADAAAQAAAQAMGCTVTVLKSAEDYQRQVEAAFESIGGENDGGTGPVA
jgi:hypothetical protein